MSGERKTPKRRFKEYINDDGWKKSKLDNLCDIYDGVHQTPNYVNSGVMFLSVEDIKTLHSKKYISQEEFKKNFVVSPDIGDILMTRIGDIGTVNVVESDLPIAYYVSLALLKTKKLNPYFLKESINSKTVKKELWKRTLHIAFPKKINKNEIGQVNILFPENGDEQRTIGVYFKKLDNLITLQQCKLEKLKALKKAYLSQMFPSDGESKPKLRFAGFNDEWEINKLGKCAGYRRGSFPQPYGKKEWYGGEESMPFVQIVDVTNNLTLAENTKQKISKLAQPFSIFVNKGAVIVTLQGSIGRVAITQYDAYFDRTILIFDNYKYDINNYFWAYVVQRKFDLEKRKAPGGTIKTITKEALSDFAISLPNKKEQNKIASFLSIMDNLINLHQCKLEKLQNLKKAYLNEMFV